MGKNVRRMSGVQDNMEDDNDIIFWKEKLDLNGLRK